MHIKQNKPEFHPTGMEIIMIHKIQKVDLIAVINNQDKNTGFLGVNEYMGLGYIKSYLTNNGISVETRILQSTEINPSQIKKLLTDPPEFIGLCMYSDNVQQVIETARQIRALFPETWISVGGPQVNRFEKQILCDHDMFDMVISYEAEKTYLEIIQRINRGDNLSGCCGVTCRDGDEIVRNPFRSPIEDLDSLPFPSRDIHEKYRQQYLYITGSRGCLGGCSFCGETSAKKDMGKPLIRQRSPHSIVNEIQELIHKYHVHSFRFTDATFEDGESGRRRAEAIFDEIIDRNLKISLHIFTRAEMVNELPLSYYEKAKRAGVECFYIGIESGNSQDIKIYHKRTTKEKNIKAIQTIRNAGIHPCIGFINFNPYSTMESVKENIDFLHTYGYGHVFYLAQTRLELLPQSYLIQRLKKDNLIDNNFDYQSYFYDYRFQDPKCFQLYKTFKKAYTASPIYYMDTLSGMNRVWAENHLTNRSWNKVEKYFMHLEDLCREYDERNYQFAVKAMELCSQGASEQVLNEWIEEANLNSIFDRYQEIYNLINIRITKERICQLT